MSLEATQQTEPLAGRVIAIAGRFAQPPSVAPLSTTVHLMHGQEDRVVPSARSIDAVEQLRALGATATLDLFPRLDHGVDGRVLERVVQRMQEGVTP